MSICVVVVSWTLLLCGIPSGRHIRICFPVNKHWLFLSLSIHPSTYLSILINKAAMNILSHFFQRLYFLQGVYTFSSGLELGDKLYQVNLIKIMSTYFPKYFWIFTFFILFHCLANTRYCQILIVANLVALKSYLTMFLIYISLITNKDEFFGAYSSFLKFFICIVDNSF